MRTGAIGIGGGVARGQQQRALEVLHGLAHGANAEQHGAAIVVDGRVLREQLDGAIENLDRLPRALAPRVGHAAVGKQGGPALVGNGLVLQRLGVERYRLVEIAARQRAVPASRARNRTEASSAATIDYAAIATVTDRARAPRCCRPIR
jgi:hypothetical protein